MRSQSGTTLAVGVFLAVLLGIGAFSLVRRGQALQGDLVITGRTPRVSAVPPITGPQQPQPQQSLPPIAAITPSVPMTFAQDAVLPIELVVHVAGAVHKPGLYHLPPTARANDAIKAAGGSKADANLDAINLAAHLEDGKQLYIPTRKEQPEGGALEQASPGPAATTHASAGHAGHAASSTSSGHTEKLSSPGQGTININTASEEQLQRLPGVGPSYAARIVQFRKENGAFTSPDQLMDVSGIGAKKFEKMRPFVRIK